MKIINDYQAIFGFTIICIFNLGCGVQPCQAMRPKGGFCYQKHGLLHDNVKIILERKQNENQQVLQAGFKVII